MLNVPIDLWTSDLNFVARIIIIETEVGDNKTIGKFIPVKFFTDEEKKVINKTYVSDAEVESALANK